MPTAALPMPRLPVAALAAALLGACALGAAGTAVVGMNAGWASAGAAWSASGAGAVAVAVAAVFGAALFALTARQTPTAAPMALLASSSVRLIGSLGLGMLLYFALTPEGKTFWASFLACGLLAIVAEAAWGVRTFNRIAVGTAEAR